MRPAGQAEVDAAQADGRWEAAYVAQRDATVPPDLEAALAANPVAAAAFAALGRTARYRVILALETARTDTARARQLELAVSRLAPEGEE